MTKPHKPQRSVKTKHPSEKTLSLKSCFERMIELLQQLVENARTLKEAAGQPISEEELLSIQEKQEILMEELVQLEACATQDSLQATDEQSALIQNLLYEFQKLNEEYIELLSQKVSVIQFAEHLKDEP